MKFYRIVGRNRPRTGAFD